MTLNKHFQELENFKQELVIAKFLTTRSDRATTTATERTETRSRDSFISNHRILLYYY